MKTWTTYLWIISPLCTIAVATLLVALFIRVKRGLDQRLQTLGATAAKLEETLGACNGKLLSIDAAHQRMEKHLKNFSERVPEALTATVKRFDTILGEIQELKSKAPAITPPDAVAVERDVLSDSWRTFRANKELADVFDSAASDERWKEISHPLLHVLPRLVPDDLKPTFEAVLAPARDYNSLLGKIAMVPRILNGEVLRMENDAQELRRTRELAQLLLLAQSSGAIGDRLNFRLKSWVVDNFLSFADLYLQRCQQAKVEKRREPALEEGITIVRQILRVAAVEPIDLELGETAFDSARHIGRSTASDARFSDGVIVGVVRNGFIDAGREVIRQPEVVVNRMR